MSSRESLRNALAETTIHVQTGNPAVPHKAKIWLFLYHPLSLPLAALVARELQAIGSECNLIYAEHSYWKYARLDDFFDCFGVVHRMPDLLLADSWLTFQVMRRKVVEEQQRLSALSLGDGDLLVSFCSTCFLPLNIIFSRFPRVSRLLITSSNNYEFAVGQEKIPGAAFSWQNVLNRCCGLLPTRLQRSKTEAGSFSEWGLFFSRPLTSVFRAVLLVDSHYTRNRAKPLPEGVYHTRVMLPRRSTVTQGAKTKVVYFSGGMVLYVKPELRSVFIAAINGFLDFIRSHFDDRVDLVYRPHPYYEAEQIHLDLSRFRVEMDGTLTELYLQSDHANIEAVFSDISSSSITALSFGLTAFSFAKLLPLTESELSSFLSQFPDVPEEHWLTSLDREARLPVSSSSSPDLNNLEFQKALRSVTRQCLPEVKFADDDGQLSFLSADHPDSIVPLQSAEQTISNLRAEIQRLYAHIEESRLKDIALMQKEQIIQELKKAADERLELLERLSKRT